MPTHWMTIPRFNRTFMELKLDNRLEVVGGFHGFNRTFMELKCLNRKPTTDRKFAVLSYLYGIEIRVEFEPQQRQRGFNRTFMELKFTREESCSA